MNAWTVRPSMTPVSIQHHIRKLGSTYTRALLVLWLYFRISYCVRPGIHHQHSPSSKVTRTFSLELVRCWLLTFIQVTSLAYATTQTQIGWQAEGRDWGQEVGCPRKIKASDSECRVSLRLSVSRKILIWLKLGSGRSERLVCMMILGCPRPEVTLP